MRRSADLSRLLADVPPPKSVLEYLVIEAWGRWHARAAWITTPEESGFFRLEAAFGPFNSATFESNPPSIWGDHALAQALMSGEGLVCPLAGEHILRPYMSGNDAKALAVQPMRPKQHERFLIAVACAGKEANAQGCLIDLITDTPLLSLYLSFLQARRTIVGDGTWVRETFESAQSLTARQSTILRLMSEGMKNREIAFAIGFSESTVRLETIEIYKKLGVHGRHEAIRVAVRLGLLEDPPRDGTRLIGADRS